MSTNHRKYPQYNGRPADPAVRQHQPTSHLARPHLKALHLATVKQGGTR